VLSESLVKSLDVARLADVESAERLERGFVRAGGRARAPGKPGMREQIEQAGPGREVAREKARRRGDQDQGRERVLFGGTPMPLEARLERTRRTLQRAIRIGGPRAQDIQLRNEL